jgi:hypothetical protein
LSGWAGSAACGNPPSSTFGSDRRDGRHGRPVTIFVAWIELAGAPPLPANAIALGARCRSPSAAISIGPSHRGAPARPASAGPRLALTRSAAVALVGLALNSLVVGLVVNVLALPYVLAIVLMVTVVQAVAFTLSKLWAFG